VTAAPATHAADRLEHALDERTDVAEAIRRGTSRPPSRRRIVRAVAWLAVTGVSLYLVAPALLETLASWEDLRDIAPGWLVAMTALQAGAFLCLWALQRIAMHTSGWYAIVTSQLAGNGMSKVAPGGGAVGAALQYRMLIRAGIDPARAVSGLTATNLLTLGIVLALPVLATPALVTGAADRGLVRVATAALAVFAVLFGVGFLTLAFDTPLSRVGGILQRVRNRLRPRAAPLEQLSSRLLRERDRILATVGRRWKAALATGVGRWVFDYASLLAALAAVGSTPRPGLVLLAFCAAQLLSQIPATPGGLGFVEAGLAAMLGLAGVSAADAVLATFAYRLLTFWLPIPLGLAGAVVHRRLYRTRPAMP
jgi:uncharacterized protein (TIRG00374 family)